MNQIRVGVLGCANIAIRSLAPAFQEHSEFQLIGFAGREDSKTYNTAQQFRCKAISSYQEMVELHDIDLIYIPLPNSLHHEWVIKSLQSGKHVICEKSLGCNYDEVKEMVRIARDKNLLLLENFQFRFHSQHQFVTQLLNAEEIGKIRCFRSSFGFPPFSDTNNIRYNKELGGGALLDAGAYTIKATHFIMGDNFQVKTATLHYDKSIDIDVFGGIYMEDNNGQIAELSFGFDNYYQCNYEIWGSSGKITSTRAFTASPSINPTIIIEKANVVKSFSLPSDNHFLNMVSHASNCIKTNNYEIEYQQNLQQAFSLEQVRQLSGKFYF